MGTIARSWCCAHDLNSKPAFYAQSCPSEGLVMSVATIIPLISIIDLISRLHFVQTFFVAAPPRAEPMSQIALRNDRKPAECLLLGRTRLGFAPGRLNKTRSCDSWSIGQRTLPRQLRTFKCHCPHVLSNNRTPQASDMCHERLQHLYTTLLCNECGFILHPVSGLSPSP